MLAEDSAEAQKLVILNSNRTIDPGHGGASYEPSVTYVNDKEAFEQGRISLLAIYNLSLWRTSSNPHRTKSLSLIQI